MTSVLPLGTNGVNPVAWRRGFPHDFNMAKKNSKKEPRISMRCSEAEYAIWEAAAEREERDINDWVRRILDLVSASGLNILELKQLLLEHSKRNGKGAE